MSSYAIPPDSWVPLGTPAPDVLADARLQLHHAVQAIASFGQGALEARADGSHQNMAWDAAVGGFRSWPCDAGVTVVVRPDPFDLQVEGPALLETLQLSGGTLAAAYTWLEDRLRAIAALEDVTLVLPEYDLPEHPVRDGGVFDADPPALAELSRWYRNAALALETVAEAEAGASVVRCWPHHFDIATLITLQATSQHGAAKTIGCGMTPGDGWYEEPYWYVTPWPYDFEAERPVLDAGGRWHSEGWLGAVLTAPALVGAGAGAGQVSRIASFLASAVEACRTIHGG